MVPRRMLVSTLCVTLASLSLVAAPTAVEFQGVTVGSKLRTTPVTFKTKVGLAGGGSLAPGLYDVEVASTGDKSRVMLLFFQSGRKMGETPGMLKLGPGGVINPCVKPGGGAIDPCWKPGGVDPCVRNRGALEPCVKPGGAAAPASSKRYLSFEQLGFAGGARATLGAGAGGGTLLTIPGSHGASIEAQLPAAH